MLQAILQLQAILHVDIDIRSLSRRVRSTRPTPPRRRPDPFHPRLRGPLVALLAAALVAPSLAGASPEPFDLNEFLAGRDRGSGARVDWLLEPDERFTPLSSLERAHLERQRERVDELARRRLGRALRGGPADLEILQRLIDARIVATDDVEALQALGVVFGDVLVHRFGYEWIGYEDERGRSRALRDPGSGQVYFPITAISRRVEAGGRTDVAALVDRFAPEYARRRDVAVSQIPDEPWIPAEPWWERLR